MKQVYFNFAADIIQIINWNMDFSGKNELKGEL